MPSKRTIPRVCRQCGIGFLAQPDRINAGGGLFCSKACFGASCDKRTPKACVSCGTVFSDKPSARDKFCSRNCANTGRGKRPPTYIDCVCQNCGAAFSVTKHMVSRGKRLFCTSDCARIGSRIDPAAMYHKRVIKQEGCWGWRGKTDRRGYPFFELRRNGGVAMYRAHRLSYEIHVGGIPENLSVLHHCDNPPCTKPDHLFVGTARDNSNDKVLKDRQARGERLPQAKLTYGQVVDILNRLAVFPRQRGAMTAIARAFNVSVATISDIERGISWKHVPRPQLGLI